MVTHTFTTALCDCVPWFGFLIHHKLLGPLSRRRAPQLRRATVYAPSFTLIYYTPAVAVLDLLNYLCGRARVVVANLSETVVEMLVKKQEALVKRKMWLKFPVPYLYSFPGRLTSRWAKF